jgi:8-oxo-dGTP diphosphatase
MTRHVVSITADIVVLNDEEEILVIKRKNPPFQEQWALPGGYVDEGEVFVQAAQRELREETGLDIDLGQFQTGRIWDAPDRDPRGRVISQSFLVRVRGKVYPVAGDDATEFMWWPRAKRGLAFDHDHIIYWTLFGK